MKLTHEFNEYVVGLVVTDEETGRTVNFQYKQIESNHPTPDYVLTWGCEGDDTYNAFDENELQVISDYVKSLDNSETLEKEITALMHSDLAEKMHDALAEQGYLSYSDIIDLHGELTIQQAKQILDSLEGDTVRITVETNTLKEATLTYPEFTSLEDDMNGDVIKGQVMFFDGVNTMGRTNQKLVRILKIEVFNHEWIEKFVA